jgi:hypothetical protein
MDNFTYYEVHFESTGISKYIKTNATRSEVVSIGGTANKYEKYERPYPEFDGEWLGKSTEEKFNVACKKVQSHGWKRIVTK